MYRPSIDTPPIEPPPNAPRSALERYRSWLQARWSLRVGLAALALGSFVKLTAELREGELDALDRAVLTRIASLRAPTLNAIAVDLTAIGSVTVVALLVSTAVLFFSLARRWRSVAQLLVASIGAGIASTLLKQILERKRPSEVPHLVEVVGFSYPSGHSLGSASVYLTLAILVSQLVPFAARIWVFAWALLIALLIGASRAYLGVHYPSDIVAGLLVGTGWALLLSALFSQV
jgi:undecaprenyl-diphosphatase